MTDRIAPLVLIAAMLAILVSSTLKSILIPVAMLCIISSSEFKCYFFEILKKSWVQLSYAFFLLSVIGIFWSVASWSETIVVLEKYVKWLYFPLIMIGFRNARVRSQGLHAYLFMCIFVAFLSWLKYLGILSWHGEDAGKVFHNHIITGLMLSLGVYISAWLALKSQGWRRVVYLGCFVLLTYQIFFIGTGRTAYILYWVALGTFCFSFLTIRRALLGTSAGVLLILIMYGLSTQMQFGVRQIKHDVVSYYQEDKATSVGFRLQFHNYAESLFKQNYWVGVGTGAYGHYFNSNQPILHWNTKLLEPHSEYWLILSEFGLLGAIIFIAFLSALGYAIFQLKEMRPFALAIFCIYLVGNCSDSLFFYSTTGDLFIMLMALCFGESLSLSRSVFNSNQIASR